MQVKRFVAANMRLALKMVREEVGEDAVILSNKRVPEGVELLIAPEQEQPDSTPSSTKVAAKVMSDNPFLTDDEPAPQEPFGKKLELSKLELEMEQLQREQQQRAKLLAETLSKQSEALREQEKAWQNGQQDDVLENLIKPDSVDLQSTSSEGTKEFAVEEKRYKKDIAEISAKTPVSYTETEESLAEMRYEIQSMRDLLEQQLGNMAWGQLTQQDPQKASLWKRMKRMGLSAAVSENLLKELALSRVSSPSDSDVSERDDWQLLMTLLVDALRATDSDLIMNGGVFAFVGPTGAGKTTSIGKLATRYVLEHGPEQVALVTTDTVRIAAHEQLRTFGRILKVPVKFVDRNNSLEQVLFSLRHKSLVLIDTAGMNRQDPRLGQQMHMLNEMANRVQTVLVMPATYQAAVMKAAYHSYKTDNMMAGILTKLDECASLGEALSLVVDKALPVAYTTHGQGVPDDIACADSSALVKLAIELAKRVIATDSDMADELSVLGRN